MESKIVLEIESLRSLKNGRVLVTASITGADTFYLRDELRRCGFRWDRWSHRWKLGNTYLNNDEFVEITTRALKDILKTIVSGELFQRMVNSAREEIKRR